MTISLVPAVIAVLLGLMATDAVDFIQSDGDTHPDAWTAFALSLLLVARDAIFRGTYFPFSRDGSVERAWSLPGLQLKDGTLRVHVGQFEPVATTLAILLGLLTTHAIAFGDAQGAGAWGWTVFGLSLFLALGLRLNPRRHRRARHHRAQRRSPNWQRFAADFEARAEEIFDDIAGEFRRPPRND